METESVSSSDGRVSDSDDGLQSVIENEILIALEIIDMLDFADLSIALKAASHAEDKVAWRYATNRGRFRLALKLQPLTIRHVTVVGEEETMCWHMVEDTDAMFNF